VGCIGLIDAVVFLVASGEEAGRDPGVFTGLSLARLTPKLQT
jgi:hypothetical protein